MSDKPKQTVYIAGPMTGYEHYNADEFERAADDWNASGFKAVTPFDANSRVWRRHYGRDFNPRVDVCDWGDPILAEMLAEDFAVLCSADRIALLYGWEKSKGARSEVLIAANLGKPIYHAVTFDRIDLTATVALSIEQPKESALQEAQRLVHGDRGKAYGHPIDDYTRTGRMWGAILGIDDIDPRICCLMMAAVKISRETNAPKRDNRVDLAGYAECAQMVAERQAEEAA
jgi:hypothetical protein